MYLVVALSRPGIIQTVNPPRQMLLAEAIARLASKYAFYTSASVCSPGDALPADAVRFYGEAMTVVSSTGAVTLTGTTSATPIIVSPASTGLQRSVSDQSGTVTLDYSAMGFTDVPRLIILPPLTTDLVPAPVLLAPPTAKVTKFLTRKLALVAGLLSGVADAGVVVYWEAIQRT